MLIITGTRSHIVSASALFRHVKEQAIELKIKLVYIGTDDNIMNLCAELGVQPEATTFIDQTQPDDAVPETLEAACKAIDATQSEVVCLMGDNVTTFAASIASHLKKIPMIKLGAGYRSGATSRETAYATISDHMAQIRCTDEQAALDSLHKEKLDGHLTGSLALETLINFEQESTSDILKKLKVSPYQYVIMSFHRPENILHKKRTMELFGTACEIQGILPVIAPLHPHTQNTSRTFGIDWKSKFAPKAIGRLGYLDHLTLLKHARCIITDSASVQDEASAMGVPCITIGKKTHKKTSISHGTNRCVDLQREDIVEATKSAINGIWPRRVSTYPNLKSKVAAQILKIVQTNKLGAGLTNPSKPDTFSGSENEYKE